MFVNYPLLCNPTLNDVSPNTYEKHKQDNPRIATNRDKKVCTLKMPNCRVELLEKLGIFDGNYPIDWLCDLSIDEPCEIISFAVDFGKNEISFEVNKI
jgi:gamma-glutamylcysteine synthetase